MGVIPKTPSPPVPAGTLATAEGHDKVARSVQLLELLQLFCIAERIVEEVDLKELQVQEKHDIKVIEEKPVTRNFGVLHQFGFRCVRDSDDDGPEVVVQIQADYLLKYQLKNRRGISKKEVRSFSEINTIVHIWPYWREYVQSQTARMGLPSIIMPVKPPREGLAQLIQRRQDEAKREK